MISYYSMKGFNKAAEDGLVIGLLPTWGDKVTKLWGVGPVIFTPANARIYGSWLGVKMPSPGYGQDWVLILDDALKNYADY
ncbi:MAG TPA: DUF4038 domain-containing protein [Puia sp.]